MEAASRRQIDHYIVVYIVVYKPLSAPVQSEAAQGHVGVHVHDR